MFREDIFREAEDNTGAIIGYIPIVNNTIPQVIMSGEPMQRVEIVEEAWDPWPDAFHGTKDSKLSSILDVGLKPSLPSHERHGLWLNFNAQEVMEWGKTVLDDLNGIVLHVKLDPTHIRQNRDRCGPSRTKLICETSEDELPAIVLQGVLSDAKDLQKNNGCRVSNSRCSKWQMGGAKTENFHMPTQRRCSARRSGST